MQATSGADEQASLKQQLEEATAQRDHSAGQLQSLLADLQRQLDDRDAVLSQLESRSEAQTAELAEATSAMAPKQAAADDLHRQLEERDAAVAQLSAQMEQQEGRIKDLADALQAAVEVRKSLLLYIPNV